MEDKAILEAMKSIQTDTLNQIDEKLEKQSQRLLQDFNTVIEDKVSHEIKIIAEGHMDIIRRLPEINELEELKSRVRVLERITQELSKTINELKKSSIEIN